MLGFIFWHPASRAWIPRNGSYSTVDGRWFAHF